MIIRNLNADQLIALEGNARSAHLMNTGVWPDFTALFLLAYGALTERCQPGTDENRWLYVILTSGGMYVCVQW